MKTASELAASVARNAPFTSPYVRNTGTLMGPVETTIPVRNPTIAPTAASCQSVILTCRAASQRLVGIIRMRNRPIAISTIRGGRTNKVLAPSAAAGMPVTEYAAHARQSTSRHQAAMRDRFACHGHDRYRLGLGP